MGKGFGKIVCRAKKEIVFGHELGDDQLHARFVRGLLVFTDSCITTTPAPCYEIDQSETLKQRLAKTIPGLYMTWHTLPVVQESVNTSRSHTRNETLRGLGNAACRAKKEFIFGNVPMVARANSASHRQ